jgi:hypothetical protein
MPIESVPTDRPPSPQPSQDACKDGRRSRVLGIVSLRTARVLGTSDCDRNALVWGFDARRRLRAFGLTSGLFERMHEGSMPWLNWP